MTTTCGATSVIICATAQPSVCRARAKIRAERPQLPPAAASTSAYITAELIDPPVAAGKQVGRGRIAKIFAGQPLPPGHGDAETAGARFDCCVRIVGLQPRPQMADLGGDSVAAGVNLAVDHQRPADAAADGNIENDAIAAAGPEKGLG